MRIGTVVNIKCPNTGYWKGKVIKIQQTRFITVQKDKGTSTVLLDFNDLVFKDNEYWER